MSIPQPFLVKVVGDLKRSGLLETVVGRGGGLKLIRQPKSVTLKQIVEAVDGPLKLTPCLIRAEDCPQGNVCPAHWSWMHLQDTMHREMESISLNDLVVRRQQKAS